MGKSGLLGKTEAVRSPEEQTRAVAAPSVARPGPRERHRLTRGDGASFTLLIQRRATSDNTASG